MLSAEEDNDAHPMLAILHLLQEMGFHITFVSDSGGSLREEALEIQGIHLLHGLDAVPLHLRAEGGKYHHMLLYGSVTAFRHLPYVRAYAPYSRVIYWMAGPQTTVHPADPSFPDDSTELHRFELFNTACADLVLAASDEETNNLLAVQPETKVFVLPNLTTYQNSDSRAMKHWADIFAATGKPIRDCDREDNEAAPSTFPGGVRHNSTPLGRVEI